MSLDPPDKCVCPHCNNNIEYDVNGAGMEIACPHCGDQLTLPDYSDDPTVVVGEYEERFLNRASDVQRDEWAFTGEGSGYHEVKPMAGNWGCILLLGLPVLFVMLAGVKIDLGGVKTDLVVVIIVACIVGVTIRRRYYAHRLKQFGNLKFVSPRKDQILEMGDDLRGRISLNLKKPLPHGSLGVSLSLLHGTKVDRGGNSWVDYRSLGRSALLVVQDVNFQSGDETVLEFSISTPKDVTSHTLRENRRKTMLKWQLTAQLMGPLGIALERQIELKVA